jgi:hypothetical protein
VSDCKYETDFGIKFFGAKSRHPRLLIMMTHHTSICVRGQVPHHD